MVHSLSAHAHYRCQRQGACCTSNWPIPVEADRLARLRAALASGALCVSDAAGGHAAVTADPSAGDDGDALLGVVDHRCVFFEPSGPPRCRVHDALGHDGLPLACRQFPRVSIHDPRGVSVTLSHYCPTAAALLDRDEAVTVVSDAPAFPPGGEYVGLDARETLPPLLRPAMLMDWDAWWELERLSVALLGSAQDGPHTALDRLSAVVAEVRTWQPQDGPLVERVRTAFDDVHAGGPVRASRARPDPARYVDAVWNAIPAAHRPPNLAVAASVREEIACRFLAAHAFANWSVHLGDGLGSWFASLEAAHALLEHGLSIRDADLLLRHLADPGHMVHVVMW